jgi:ribosomal subunit interface protein
MNIQITGKHIDIGDALRTHVTDRVNSGVVKYFDRPVDAFVVFAKEGSEYRCDTSVHLSSGIRLQSSGQAGEIYSSFEIAAEHLETRLRRYKRRLKHHHNANKSHQPIEASAYVIQSTDSEEDTEAEPQPVIIAEDVTKISTLSVGEAVMQMDLQDTPVVLFKNGANGALNVVYRRHDGHIGWIDPQNIPSN